MDKVKNSKKIVKSMNNLEEHIKKLQYFTQNTFVYNCMLIGFIMFFAQIMFSKNVFAYDVDKNKILATPMVTDERLKHLVFNENEIFQVTFKVGYQSIIELQEDENINIVIFGDRTPWKFRALGRRLFLKATMPNVETNMIIYTDKRRYFFEISSSDGYDNDRPITYAIDFFYPDINVDVPPTATKLAKIALNRMANVNNAMIKKLPHLQNNVVADASSINANYTYSTKGNTKYILPTMVFDNGKKTYFKFDNTEILPTISILNENYEEKPLRIKKSGEYVYIDTTAKRLTIRDDKSLVCLFNEKKIKKTEIAYISK